MTQSNATSDRSIRCLSTYEKLARERGYACIAGVDEVGRGSLFGPVLAAAVVQNPERPIRGLKDSKVLDAGDRADLAAEIQRKCLGWAAGAADAF
ncbi:MAG: ribonuclease HII, partial [Bryobacteraceae bacterium]